MLRVEAYPDGLLPGKVAGSATISCNTVQVKGSYLEEIPCSGDYQPRKSPRVGRDGCYFYAGAAGQLPAYKN